MSSDGYMMAPPTGEDRWAAGTMATAQRTIGAVLFTFATVIYVLRIFTRLRLMKNSLRLDDFLTGAALVCCWVFYGCTMGMVSFGGCAKNFWQVTLAEYETLLKWTVPVNIFYMLSSDLAKVSLLFFYMRLCPERKFRITVQILVACFVSYGIIYAFISLFGCRPIYAAWNLEAQATGTCINKFRFFLAASVANVVMDLIILLLPLRIVVPLQIPTRQKISLLILFATGGFVIIVATYNCVLTVHLFSSDNYTWGLANELSWMYAELTGCVICASASSLKPLVVRLLPGIFGSHMGSYGNSGSSGVSQKAPKGSFVSKNRRQFSRRANDAIELESADDADSAKKPFDDDEANLWPKPGKDIEDNAGNVQASAPIREVRAYATSPGKDFDGPLGLSDKGINVVVTAEVMYSNRE